MGMVNAFEALMLTRLFGDVAPGSLGILPGSLLALAAGLAITAFGLRRGSRTAYWLSLAGMVLPVLIVVAASVFDASTTYVTSGYFSSGEGRDVTSLRNQLAIWTTMSSIINGLVPVPALGLAATTVGMLMTRASRRFFVGSARPGEPAAS